MLENIVISIATIISVPSSASPSKSPSVGSSETSSQSSSDLTIFVMQPSTKPGPYLDPVKVANLSTGPYLDPAKVANLPEAFGPGPLHRVLRESVQHLVDAALDQRKIFELLKPNQGDGKVIITASFEDKMHKLR